MTSVQLMRPKTSKAPTGIAGFDEITGGGLPRGRTTLVVGGPGSRKTVLALLFLVHGAQCLNEPGIFVAFEKTSKRIAANAAQFGWSFASLLRKKLSVLDAQPTPPPRMTVTPALQPRSSRSASCSSWWIAR
jgi:circadian clock protein KaiC